MFITENLLSIFGVRLSMVKSKYRGHEIKEINGIWFYCNNNIPVESIKNISCGHCNKSQTKEGYDDCLGKLPGLMNACCGHGNIDEMYIQFLNGICVTGKEAFLIIKKLKYEKMKKICNPTSNWNFTPFKKVCIIRRKECIEKNCRILKKEDVS